MSVEFSVPLSQIAEALNLTEVYVAENYKETNISTVEINRPGLELTGYLEFFDNKRIQVLGNTEFSYLGRYGPEAQKMVIDSIFSFGPPAVIICRDIEPSNAILESAKLHKVSIFSTPQSTSDLTASLVQYLNKELAPRITRHGVLVEVYGEGCLLTGDSGVGKSETAIELIKRGHRLVADDAVEIRRTAQTTLYGQSPENIRHFIELRGIGIINARKLFGMGAIKLQQISTASKEASGTGNMKFMLNGAPTLGTMDGANVEIVEEVGAENAFIFGLSSDEVINYENNGGYDPNVIYNTDEEIRQVLMQLINGTFSNDTELFRDLYDSLLNTKNTDRADRYFILADFRSYADAQKRVEAAYRDEKGWAKKALLNTACSGKFTSDRTIQEYVDDIWHLDKVIVRKK